ncbi:4-hydroxythreonine-4-phosphate dehydrogenase PdxA [Cytobacillus dafuensis]|uniref:4-hydroxythreonine-4-phosphate dehydrogenase PdxA n=1 Tax=Cytobacillus dafuensis TaxID=1742359 RepID=A0A5B8Z1Y1_CYTDA|nr:4-hydroxythreonine-4-phosphate dehydrogenase PdxA [Cytobacillus dafuensis]QED47040.1 4-hydroxythreonine-4-phosphate dehydrogenase PdxA [Cytobacillus dafuensis]
MLNKKIQKPIIAIPMGDPAGIGPEITISALNSSELYEICSPLVIGNSALLNNALRVKGIHLEINEISDPGKGEYEHGTIDVISLDNIDINQYKVGVVQSQCGQAAFEYIEKAINLALEGKVNALATTPINKESLRAANIPYIGHTEILAALTNTEDPLTMFEVNNLRIFFLTRHYSLSEAISKIRRERICKSLIKCDKALESIGINRRKLVVAALNPHGGEGGLFGTEELEEIQPGIEMACKENIDVAGLVPADSVFYQALNGKYDAVLSLYHDQGHIAAKMTDFEKTISITLGLPFIRTSVDHGTAFDIAGQGIASSVSMEECIKLAAKYAKYYSSSIFNHKD